MNWEAIGAIGELVGALAVVISVIYLAVQIRSGSAALTTNIRDSVFATLEQWNYQLTADPEFAWVFHRGLNDFDSLDEKERPRFMHMTYAFFKIFENIYLHYLEGSVGSEVWVRNREIVHAYYVTPGAQYYIGSRRSAFDERFLQTLEDMGTPNISATPKAILQGTDGGIKADT
jgi:hypothetical protein